jgi:uncharacterized protein YvpB
MISVFGLKFIFENLLIITSITALTLTIANLGFGVFYFIKKLRSKKNKSTVNPEFSFQNKSSYQKQKFSLKTFLNSFKKKESYKFFIHPIFWIVFLNLFGFAFIIQAFIAMFYGNPEIVYRYPMSEQEWENPRRPIVIEFDRPIDTETLNFDLMPQIEGEIEFEKSFEQLPFSRKVYFYPKEMIEPGFTIYNYLNGVKSILNEKPRNDIEIYFQWYKPVELERSSIEDLAEDVLVNESFTFELNKDYDEFTDFEFEFSPAVEFDKQIENDFIRIIPKNTFAQSSAYKLFVFRTSKLLNLETNEIITKLPRETIKEINFTTVKAPEIKSFEPTGNAAFVDADIKIEFSKEMYPESVLEKLSINPSFEFTPEWSENNSILILRRNSNLEYGKEYEIKIASGALGRGDAVLENDFGFKFTTIAEAKIINISPGNGAGGIELQTPIRITFDQQVDKASAQSKFSINPPIAMNFTWDGNTMIARPSTNYSFQTRYTYTISSGVKSINGLNSNQNFTYSFTTKSQTFALNVPLYRQSPYAFGCNVTSASMVMAYKGINVSNLQIYNSLPKSGPLTREGDTWGDPDIGFVGPLTSGGGYGVHWTPISNYLSSQGVSNQVRRGMTASELAKEIEAGRPAIIWWWNQINRSSSGGPISQSWTTPEGKQINTIVGMHSEVVIGFNGSSDNPTSFILNDPRGSRRTVSISTFNYLWGIYGNTAIIVQ